MTRERRRWAADSQRLINGAPIVVARRRFSETGRVDSVLEGERPIGCEMRVPNDPGALHDAFVISARRSTVLVVDDDDDVREVIAEVLTEVSLDVLQADRAAAAWALIEAHPELDVLVTDLMMPGESGTSLARRVRSVRPTLPVVLISAHLDERLETEGVVAVLAKPFTRHELLGVIGEALTAARRGGHPVQS